MASISVSISGTSVSISVSTPAASSAQASSVAPSTVTATLPLSSTTAPSTQPLSTSTSVVSQAPSTVIVAPTTSSIPPVVVSSTVLVNPATTGGTGGPSIVTITSTQDAVTFTPSITVPASSSSSHSASPSILGASNNNGGSGGGLGTSGKIAIAVIIPVVLIAGLFLFGLFLWRKRKAKKSAEEQRKNEMAEYGFNPNNDPDLIPVGAAYTDGGSEGEEGYRGWGTTTSNARKPSTTLGSNSKAPNGMTYSDTASQPGNYGYQGSPNGHASEAWSGDPLVGGHHEGIDGVSALGGAAVAGGAAAAISRNNRTSQGGIQRGPSNASSSYSHNPPHSEASSDTPGNIVNYYQEEVPYNIYNDVAPSHGPYGEGNYAAPGTDQPVIRDVQARRNTRIERVPTFPQTQGGIAQNF